MQPIYFDGGKRWGQLLHALLYAAHNLREKVLSLLVL